MDFHKVLAFLLLSCSLCNGQDQLQIDVGQVKHLLETWTDYHNNKNLPSLEKMYADEVMFYAKKLPRSSCIGQKSLRLHSKKYFHQEIVSEPSVTAYNSGIIKVAFVKRITSGTNVNDYDAYLLLRNIDNKFLIVGESDLIADGIAKYEPDLGKELVPSKLSKIQPNGQAKSESALLKGSGGFKTFGLLALTIGIIVIGVSLIIRRKKIKTNSSERAVSSPSTPEADGFAFEQFIVKRFYSSNKPEKKYFTIEEWRGDKIVDGVYPKSNLNPDLEITFTYGDFKRRFAIECKFRRSLMAKVFVLNTWQLQNYINFERQKGVPTYVILGLGGSPDRPNELYVIPLKNFHSNGTISIQEMRHLYNDPDQGFFYDHKADKLKTVTKG